MPGLMTPRLVFAIIFSLYLLAFTFHATSLGKTVYGDGIYYYNWLQTMLGAVEPLANNKYSIGPALFWLPFHIGSVIALHFGELIVGYTSVFYATAGLVLLYRLLIQKFSQISSLATILLTAFATNLFFYGAVDPVNSHPLSFFTVALFLSFLWQKSWFVAGIALGLVGIVRPQDMVVVLLARNVNWQQFLLGLALGFSPQMIAWHFMYGSPVALPYLAAGEGFSFSPINILGVLFAPSNGLFLWTPLTMLGLIGAWFYKKPFALVILLELFIVASWSTWWQGASYSGRMFVGMLPLLAFGTAWVISKLKIPKTALYLLVCSLSTVNTILILYFLASR